MNLVYKKLLTPLLDQEKVKKNFDAFKASKPSTQLVFDSNVLCGTFVPTQKDTLNIFECKFSEYIYARSQNLNIYSLGGFACILTKEGRMLVIRRGKNLLYYPNYLSLVGGHLAFNAHVSHSVSGDAIFKMTNEEVKEELGFDLEKLECNYRFCFHSVSEERKSIHFYFIVQTKLSEQEIIDMVTKDEVEVEEVRFVSADELRSLKEGISPVLEKFVQYASKVDNHGTNDILSLENYDEDILYIQ